MGIDFGRPCSAQDQGPEGKWEVQEPMVAQSRVLVDLGDRGFQRSWVVSWSGLRCGGGGHPG